MSILVRRCEAEQEKAKHGVIGWTACHRNCIPWHRDIEILAGREVAHLQGYTMNSLMKYSERVDLNAFLVLILAIPLVVMNWVVICQLFSHNLWLGMMLAVPFGLLVFCWMYDVFLKNLWLGLGLAIPLGALVYWGIYELFFH